MAATLGFLTFLLHCSSSWWCSKCWRFNWIGQHWDCSKFDTFPF